MRPKRPIRSNPTRTVRRKIDYNESQQDDNNINFLRHEERPSIVSSPRYPPSQRLHAELLAKDSSRILSSGVDFGTVNTSLAWITLPKKSKQNIDYVKHIRCLRTHDEQIRYPTVVAVQPDMDDPTHGRLIFADRANEALNNGQITADDMISFPKFGLIKSFEGIFEQDRGLISDVQERHNRALDRISHFSKITTVYHDYPDRERAIKLRTIEDVIVQYLRYFLGLFKRGLTEALEFNMQEVEAMFALDNVESSFAAPTFWSDTMLDTYLRLIEKAGWPSRTRIWSEPKAAAVAHIALAYADSTPNDKDKLQEFYVQTPMVFCDIGGASLDTTTIQTTEMTDHSIRLASIAESGGSLCGGRRLDALLESVIIKKFGPDFRDIRQRVSSGQEAIHGQDFLQAFQYDSCRKNFDGAFGREYVAYYGGNNLPAALYRHYMTTKGVLLTRSEMIAVHDEYLQEILTQIRLQIARTKQSISSDSDVYLVLAGGVTRSPYLVNKIREELQGKEVAGMLAVERMNEPIVALVCILCLRQPDFGGRHISKEAYALPVARKYIKSKHKAQSRQQTGRSDLNHDEARDLADWIVPVGADASPGTEHSDFFVVDFAIQNDDGSPYASNPEDHPNLQIVMEQIILSTSDPVVGRQEAPYYRGNESIHNRKTLRFTLSKQRLDEIARNAKCDKIGFWQDQENFQWFFSVAVQVVLDWPDMRLRWRVRVPKTGAFYLPGTDTLDPNLRYWEMEVFLASSNNHGVHDGDELLKSE